MSPLKKLKPHYYLLKWYLLCLRLNVVDKRYRSFTSYFRGSSANLDYLNGKLRMALRLNPTWARGHFYLAILAFRSFEFSKNSHFKGVIRISNQALRDLKFSKSHVDLVQAIYHFVRKEYTDVLDVLEKLNFTEFPQSDPLNIIGSEIMASSFLILGDNRNAYRSLKNIEQSHQSAEVVEMLKFLNSNK